MINSLSKSMNLARQEDRLSRIIPYSYSLTDQIVVSRAGDYLSTWTVEGLAHDGLSALELKSKMDALNRLVQSLSNGKYAFWIHRVRRRIADSLTLPPGKFASDMMKRYYAQFEQGHLMATEIYVTVLYRPRAGSGSGLLGSKPRSQAEFRLENTNAIDVMDALSRQVSASLDAYKPRQLSTFKREGVEYSELLSFYGFLINNYWRDIPFKDVPLNKYLGIARVTHGHETTVTHDEHGSIYSLWVDIKDYNSFTEPGILNGMISLPFEYVETQSFSPMNTRDAQAVLRRQKNQLVSSQDNAASQVDEIDLAIDRVQSGDFSFGEYHYTLQVKGSSMDEAKTGRSLAIDALNKQGFIGVPIELIPEHAYCAQLPGNHKSRPRTANLSSMNFAGLASMHNFRSGKRDGNPWGEAVTILKSPAQQPVYLNLHYTDEGKDNFGDKALGNTQIIGQSGGGKTVLGLFIMMNLMKYGTQMVAFDKDRGMEIAIRALGGKYMPLIRGESTGFSPFKMGGNKPDEETILMWQSMITFCAQREDMPLTPKDEADIETAVRSVAQLPQNLRGFQAIINMLPVSHENSVSSRLRKWSAGDGRMRAGEYAWALDNPTDDLTFDDCKLFGFDYTELLEDDSVRPAVMIYLLYRVEQLLDGRRFAFFMDEYWKAIGDPYFEKFAKDKQKTIRKQNGIGVYMTQSPSDALSSKISRTLIEQTATYIFLPNEKANEAEYCDGFKLTKDQYETIRTMPVASRMFAIKQGQHFQLAGLDLYGFKKDLKVFSGSTDNVAVLERLRKRLGDDPEAWLPAFQGGETA